MPVEYSVLRLHVGTEIRRRRRDLKMTASRLAREVGVHRNTISRVENGEQLSIDAFYRISLVLDMSVDLIFDTVPVMRKPVQSAQPLEVRSNGTNFL